MLDSNGDGMISRDELIKGYRLLGEQQALEEDVET